MVLEVYGHGGDVWTASAKYGVDAERFIDFSANINPLGPPPGLLDKLREALPAVTAYPDPGHRALIAKLADKLQREESCFVIGNGAAENMALALLAAGPKKVGIVEPCFSEYEALSRQFGAAVTSVRGTEELAFRAEPEAVRQLIESSDLVFIGQPNNPNGVQYSLDELRSFAEAGEQCGSYVIIDEAFIDFIPESGRQTLLGELDRYTRLILVRSMTKFYAIPGLRLGYAVAHPQTARSMRDKQVTWSVNALALLAGEVCLDAGSAFEEATISLIAKQRAMLRQSLEQLGCRTWPGEANFLLVRLPEGKTAAGVQAALGAKGVLVRSCAMYKGLSERDIRVAVKNEPACLQLMEKMKHVLSGGERE
ncbi:MULTISPECIES: threonine-phosphate decarboxylase [Paenibacillus]|uniref:pyridoxal phosphate-dependent aminotransferase n=1 Tax=Paenibacillus TaxID=44249 RepID=UPI002FE12B85